MTAQSDILLAEDNLLNQKVALLALKKLGLTADAVVNGAEVLKALEQHQYRVILMDIEMPEMDGLEATAEIIRHYGEQRPRIVALTGHSSGHEKFIAAGMDACLEKPFKAEALRDVLAL